MDTAEQEIDETCDDTSTDDVRQRDQVFPRRTRRRGALKQQGTDNYRTPIGRTGDLPCRIDSSPMLPESSEIQSAKEPRRKEYARDHDHDKSHRYGHRTLDRFDEREEGSATQRTIDCAENHQSLVAVRRADVDFQGGHANEPPALMRSASHNGSPNTNEPL